MIPIKVTIHGIGTGSCVVSGHETDGLTVTFEDGTVNNQFLSWRSFRQLLSLKSQHQPTLQHGERNPLPQ